MNQEQGGALEKGLPFFLIDYPDPSGTWGVLNSGIWLSLNVPGGWIYLAILYVGLFPPLLPLLFLQYKAKGRKGQQK